MSDIVEQYYRYRKFCKVIGLHSVFNFDADDNSLYDTSYLDEIKVNEVFNPDGNALPITNDTILFITADSSDEGNKIEISAGEVDEEENKIKTIRTLSEFDTMLWVNGNIYCLSQNSVKSINYKDGKYTIVYSDDKSEELVITNTNSGGSEYSAVFPLEITPVGTDGNTKRIHFVGTNAMNNQTNFIVNIKNPEVNLPENNINTADFNYLTIFGKGNIASSDGQIILGNFNEVNEESSNYKFVLCNGVSDNERKNIFTVSNGGTVLALEDFVLSTETNKITHRLSDIHSVTNDDWYKET